MDVLDNKRRRLIDAWLDRTWQDEYSRYMSAWVAFNALCYGLFAKEAVRQRPELSDKRGLDGLVGVIPAEGSIKVCEGRISIRFATPGRIRIDISERYTEDLIFSAFARRFQPEYIRWLEVAQFSAELGRFLEVIRRQCGDYVINMLRIDQHSPDHELKYMENRNIVVAITDRADLSQLVAVLYQVRNNLFHGEKVPGDVNDDRIVRAARPVLEGLVKLAYKATAESVPVVDRPLRGG